MLILRLLDFRGNIGRSTDPSSEYVFRRAADFAYGEAGRAELAGALRRLYS